MSKANLVPIYLSSWAPGAHIVHTSNSSSNDLKNKFHMNPVETFCKIDENFNFNLFWQFLSSKGPQDISYTFKFLQHACKIIFMITQ